MVKEIDTKKAIVKCKELEIIEGEKEAPLWIMQIDDDLKIVLDKKEYMDLMNSLKEVMKENFELKLEREILSEFPIDYEDVKAVVLEKMKENNNLSIKDTVRKVKEQHPNLFFEVDLNKLF